MADLITFTTHNENLLAVTLEKIVSIYDEWEPEKKAGITTIDLINGFSYQVFHNEEQLGAELCNAIESNSVEDTIFADYVEVLKAVKVK